MSPLAPVAKAIVGFIAPGAALLISAVTESSVAGSAITGGEWVTAICTCLVTAGAVYAIPNARANADAEDAPPEA